MDLTRVSEYIPQISFFAYTKDFNIFPLTSNGELHESKGVLFQYHQYHIYLHFVSNLVNETCRRTDGRTGMTSLLHS
jgi:hypothetical protein